MTNENGLLAKLMRGKTFAIRKSVVFALIGGILIGSGSVLFFQWYNPGDVPKSSAFDASLIMNRIVDRNEMVAASQDYTIVEKAGDRNKLFVSSRSPLRRIVFGIATRELSKRRSI